MRAHPLGLGESLGDDLIINGPLVHSGQVWWVDFAVGANAASPRGLERSYPLATLAQAVSNAASGDIIVLMDGHNETISTAAPLVISKRLVIVGSGLSSGKPTAKLAFTGSATSPISVTGAQVELRNIWFEAQGTANTNAKISAVEEGFRMRGCYMECNANDDGFGVDCGFDYAELRDCTFVSTALTPATAPKAALIMKGAGSRVDGCVFDGGLSGWLNGWAIDFDGGSDVLDIRMENLTLTRGSDVRLTTGTVGYVLASVGSYAPRLDWSGTAGG